MSRGIEIDDVLVGQGEEVLAGKTVLVNLRTYLHRGEEVSFYPEPRVRLNLKGRECIAGLRNGIVGMRVGGKRTLIVSPHLAYGTKGIPEKIPPNALLRFEVELLEVGEPGELRPEDSPEGRRVAVYHPGEAARNLPRWQFSLSEDGNYGAALHFPIPGMTWRQTRNKQFQANVEGAIATAILNDIENLPVQFPDECLAAEECWADRSEPAGSLVRDRQTNTLCLTIDIWEKGQHKYFRIRENSLALNESQLFKLIDSLLQPHFAMDKLKPSQPEHSKPEQSNPRTTPHLPD